MNGYIPLQQVSVVSDRQPFSSVEEIENFLDKMNSDESLSSDISIWMRQHLKSYPNGAAIVFVRRPLNLNKLYQNTSATIDSLYKVVCKEKHAIKAMLEAYRTEEKTLTKKMAADRTEIVKRSIQNATEKEKRELKKLQSDYTIDQQKHLSLRSLIESLDKEHMGLTDKLTELQKQFDEANNFFVEDTTQILSTVITSEHGESSDYLLNRRNVLVVLLGNSFNSHSIQVVNGKKSVDVGLANLMKLATTVTGIKNGAKYERDKDCDPVNPDRSMQLTFFLLKQRSIDPPSALNLTKQEKVVKTLADIHEKSYLGIKVGLGLHRLENKDFRLNSNNELTIQTDSLRADELKLNLMALVEFYPFGRDYDRLKLITDKDNIPFHERIGIVAGLKISKDPLESYFAGISLAISKAFNVVAGTSFNKTPEDVDELQVGTNASLEYLRRHSDKQYVPKLYLGISVSPESLFKVFGVKD
ncbi:hypothetical protein [Pedobacter deserti]|uniref:hypothetical protein n=1 Tax=Pedobacter deserti TaxID=2817382 RepID=UPI00210B1913|nr:hypothetical protein [Pedobacter sp. SYSU D00382]